MPNYNSRFLPIHLSLLRHPKLLRLVRKLNINPVQAVGHLVYLWAFTLDYTDDGDLSGFEPAEIAEAARWVGDSNEFVAALEAVGFVEEKRIHDWDDYVGRLIRMRAQDAKRKRQDRSIRSGDPAQGQRVSSGHPETARRTSGPTLRDMKKQEMTASMAATRTDDRDSVADSGESAMEDPSEDKLPVRDGPPRDDLFDSVVEQCGIDLDSMTKSARGALNAALRDMRDLNKPVTAAEVRTLADKWPRYFSVSMTPSALAKNVWLLRGQPAPKRRTDSRRAYDQQEGSIVNEYTQIQEEVASEPSAAARRDTDGELRPA